MRSIGYCIAVAYISYKIDTTPLSFPTYKSVLFRFASFCKIHCYTRLNQQVINHFMSSGKGCKVRLSKYGSVLKKLDKIAQSHLCYPDGRLLNTLVLPRKDECQKFLDSNYSDTPIKFVAAIALEQLNKYQYSDTNKRLYYIACNILFHTAFHSYGNDFFTKEVCNKAVSDLKDIASYKDCKKDIIKAIFTLNKMVKNGFVLEPNEKLSCIQKQENQPSFLFTLRSNLQEHLLQKQLSTTTIKTYLYQLEKIVVILGINSYKELQDMNANQVKLLVTYASERHSQSYLPKAIRGLKRLLRVLVELGHIADARVVSEITVPPSSREQRIKPTLSSKDIDLILNQLPKESFFLQSALLLAMTYGLRRSDIVNLKIEYIDWEREIISFYQSKSHEPLELPLTIEVGNAVLGYLKNERPKSQEPYLFVTRVAPHKKYKNLNFLLSEFFKRLNIKTKPIVSYGFHVFRYSIVKYLMEKDTPPSLISNTLGHSEKRSLYYYVSMEDVKKSMCPLTLDGIASDNLWRPKA